MEKLLLLSILFIVILIILVFAGYIATKQEIKKSDIDAFLESRKNITNNKSKQC